MRYGFIIFCTSLFLLDACRQHETNSFSNRLQQASSPYLREHADNPVDWYEWSDAALEKAAREDKPIIISIGYAACHWCHVMEEESFMDTTVARIMNENFVSIKIDREERPDIDQVYITAAQLISGNAGWPLNAFALPDGKPFYAGTYFTKQQWISILAQVQHAYHEEHSKMVKQANAITRGVLEHDMIKPVLSHEQSPFAEAHKKIIPTWKPQLDTLKGGLLGAPKFPMPGVWEFLMQDYHYTGNQKSLEAVTTTLDAMANGSIYDHLGGGFARYATDEDWIVPHFEKMLYDNGQLVSLYAHAYQLTKNERYARVVQETLEFIRKELTSPEGGFYASLNADSEDEEGTYYVWTKKEVEAVVDAQAQPMITDYFAITEPGNWENGKNVLHRKVAEEELARKYHLPITDFMNVINGAREKLVAARARRVRPSLDNKILTSWNALMLVGYLDAYQATGKPDYLTVAIKNAMFLKKNMLRESGQLWRSHANGKSSIDAFLDDYALLSNAFIKMYQVTFDKQWLDDARQIVDYAVKNFLDEPSGFFYFTPATSQLVVRKMEISDQVIPSSNAVMAESLAALGHYYDDEAYLQLSERMIRHMAGDAARNDPYYYRWTSLIAKQTFQHFEVAIMGDDHRARSSEMMKHYLPDVLWMGGTRENLPLLENKSVQGKTIIYVCQNKICKLPVMDAYKALEQMERSGTD